MARKAAPLSVRSGAQPVGREETEVESRAVGTSARTAVPGNRGGAFCQHRLPFRESLTQGLSPVRSLVFSSAELNAVEVNPVFRQYLVSQ